MAIKRILVNFEPRDQQDSTRLDAAVLLARQFDAQLQGLFVLEADAAPDAIEGRGASFAYLSESTALLKERAVHIETAFKDRCEREHLSCIWNCMEGDPLDVLTAFSFCADISIVGQQQSGGLDYAISLHRTDYLPLCSPGPVLILPRSYRTPVKPEHILIAWKAERSCAKAVQGSLPFLTRAKSVTLLIVDPPSDQHLSDRAIAKYLSAHGVEVVPQIRKSGTFGSVSDTILSATRELGSDILVMGAHGHSRLAQLIFGGATHDTLRKMHLPVLMCH